VRRLVCPLGTALYGRPDAGGYWEQRCDQRLQDWIRSKCARGQVGAKLLLQQILQCCVIVYVDDFEIAGPTDNVRNAWKLIKAPNPRAKERCLILDEPLPAGKFLGCSPVCHEIDRPRMSVDRKTVAMSLVPEVAAIAAGNHVSANATDNAGDRVTTKAVGNPILIPSGTSHIPHPGVIRCRQIEYDVSDFLGSCVRLCRDLTNTQRVR
jgi:hypothetical protein